MAIKSNRVQLIIAYSQNFNDRHTFDTELDMLSDINRVLLGHVELTGRIESVKPQVTQDSTNSYACRLELQFPILHKDGKQYPYSRLHHVLQELSAVVTKYEERFQRIETYLDLTGMSEPWCLVAGPSQVLLRKGAVQWNARGDDIPCRDSKFYTPINGMTVMGEPMAVDKFRRVWQQKARSHIESLGVEREAMERSNVATGCPLDIVSLRRSHPKIQWQHLLIWVHTEVDGNGAWYVVNLDEKDKWVLAGVQYVNVNMKSMMEDDLPFTKQRGFVKGPNDLRFFKEMEYHTFEDRPDSPAIGLHFKPTICGEVAATEVPAIEWRAPEEAV